MRGQALALVVGVILGAAGTASAASGVWKRDQGPYVCSGNATSAKCTRKGSPWNVRVTRLGVSVHYGNLQQGYGSGPYGVVMICQASFPPEECLDYRD